MQSNAQPATNQTHKDVQNKVYISLMWISFIIMFCALFGGLYLGTQGTQSGSGFNWSMALLWWISGGISGLVLLGFGEIVNILDQINKKLAK